MDNKRNIASNFQFSGTINGIKILSAGHINDSYVIETTEDNKPDFLLQRINHYVFKNVDLLQSNILKVTKHIRKKLIKNGESDIDRKVLKVVLAKNGDPYYFDGNEYWRMYEFIAGGVGLNTINPELAFKAGKAFGDFQSYLADLPEELGETIPDFHNMEFRLIQFRQAIEENKVGRVASNMSLIQSIERRAEEMCLPNRLYREGKLPKRTNHCDTKVNNILFDSNGEVLCVVDLDTVMPGFVLSDFGDFIRTGANKGEEDDADLNKIGINIDIFKAYAKGYAEKAKSFLLPIEIEYLAFGAKLLTYMQTVRFFTDYLNGDVYYRIHSPEHNLQRTKAQLRLLEDMEKHYPQMCEEISNAFK